MNDYEITNSALTIVGSACSCTKEELMDHINQINNVIGTDYYESRGDILLRQIVDYLKSRLQDVK